MFSGLQRPKMTLTQKIQKNSYQNWVVFCFLQECHLGPLEPIKREILVFQYLKVSRRSPRPFSQPFGFIHELVGYQMKADSVLSNIYFQHLKFELQIQPLEGVKCRKLNSGTFLFTFSLITCDKQFFPIFLLVFQIATDPRIQKMSSKLPRKISINFQSTLFEKVNKLPSALQGAKKKFFVSSKIITWA